ncbi:hypothetical protein BDZ45DRAFT_677775 [Acephala macrosclerotiorum]|nr:hypothetical protein BDZ45DRAFT_677775 [Acephala macrosclerotiorum]
MPLSQLVAQHCSISTTAQAIRESANYISTAGLLDAYTVARSVPDYGSLTFCPMADLLCRYRPC